MFSPTDKKMSIFTKRDFPKTEISENPTKICKQDLSVSQTTQDWFTKLSKQIHYR